MSVWSLEERREKHEQNTHSYTHIHSKKQNLSVDGFKPHVRRSRSDKGKRHSYPSIRKRWNCQGKSLNLNLNGGNAKETSVKHMGKKFKGSPSMREYWRKMKTKAKKE